MADVFKAIGYFILGVLAIPIAAIFTILCIARWMANASLKELDIPEI